MKRVNFILVFVLSILLATSVIAQELKPVTLTWVAGGVGGGWYAQAGAIASLINQKEPKISIKVVPGGGVVNPVQVSSGDADLGWGITFVDKMALLGVPPLYEKPNPKVRSLGGYFGYYHIHFVASADKGITTVEELANMIKAGKSVRIAIPMKGTSDLPIVERILKFYGVTLDQIKKAGGEYFHATYADMISLYKDRHVDFVCTHLSLPAAAVTEMFISRKSVLLPVSNECIDAISKELGTVPRSSGLCVIPAGTYQGQDNDVAAVVTAGELLINADVPEIVAYTITKILCENVQELWNVHPANKTFVPENGPKNVAVPLHPGAERYYREAGYLK
ncbi:MAG: TAXI family TRAP transporter solute-binding subunit [Pseudothermotoga sp.]